MGTNTHRYSHRSTCAYPWVICTHDSPYLIKIFIIGQFASISSKMNETKMCIIQCGFKIWFKVIM